MEARAEIFPKTLTLQMDFDKSLKTPKVSAQDSYYKLKLKTHQMGIFCANNETIHCFLYDETVGTTGPNEVISLLDYLLNVLKDKLGKHDHIIIWCDNAPGQFKECYLFFYLDHLIRNKQFLRADLNSCLRVIRTLFVIDDLGLYKGSSKAKKLLTSQRHGQAFYKRATCQTFQFTGSH